ncbi:MAG TPA: Hsp20/alpha crystallin family protein [Thermoplasmata archaeon]|nr:Hsp20/alpha crystallin family protein [Thermoplasmata archaeon]
MKIRKSARKSKDLMVPEQIDWGLTPFSLWDKMDEFFEDFKKEFFGSFPMRWRSFFTPLREVEDMIVSPSMDIEEKEDRYNVTVELPGVPKDNIEVNITEEGLEIKAALEETKEEKKKNFIHRERCYQGYQRAVSFQKEIDPDKAEAELKDGILRITLPKKETDKKEVKKLKIK